jgi:hypothetical protein
VAILTGAFIGLLIAMVLRVRRDWLADGLVLPLLVAGSLLVLSSRAPLEIVTALLVAAYTVTLTEARARR